MRIFLAFSVALSVTAFGFLPSARATDRIGLAAAIKNNVSKIEPSSGKILSGDDVYRDEVVRTFDDSSAKFVLLDSTNLVLGPNSTLKLDRAVFSNEKGVGDVAIKLTVGSFRFITGTSAKEAYSITTPIATLGVRGTILDMLIERFKNTVVLKEGQSRVCAGTECVELLKVGDTAVITSAAGKIQVTFSSSSSWSFDSSCGGMCGQTSFAEAENSLTTGSIGGAGGSGGGGGTSGGGPTNSSGFSGGGFSSPLSGTPNTFRNLTAGAFGGISALSTSPQ